MPLNPLHCVPAIFLTNETMHHIVLLFHQAGSFLGGAAFVEWSKSKPPVFLRTPHTPPKTTPEAMKPAQTCPPPPVPAAAASVQTDAVETIFSGVCGSGGGMGGTVRWWIIVPDTYESLRTTHDTQRTSQTPLRNYGFISLHLI